MPQIGWLEILIIVSIAIIVVGPKDFPIMIKKIGSWVGSIKRYVNNFLLALRKSFILLIIFFSSYIH